MYVQRDIKARSRNHCCSRKAISITYAERESVGLVNQRAMRMRHKDIGHLPGSTIFSHII